MFRRFLANALALAVAALLVPGIALTGATVVDKGLTVLGVAVIFGLLNAIVRPLFKVLTGALILLTLGLFLLVINMVMLMLTSWVCGQLGVGFHVNGWLAAFIGSLLVSAVSWTVNKVIKERDDER